MCLLGFCLFAYPNGFFLTLTHAAEVLVYASGRKSPRILAVVSNREAHTETWYVGSWAGEMGIAGCAAGWEQRWMPGGIVLAS